MRVALKEFNRIFWGMTLLAISPAVHGQVGSRIAGAVRDSSGAVIYGARVTLTDIHHGIKQTTLSNEAGRYAFPNLDVGAYTVSTEMPGFKTAVTALLSLEANQSLDVDIAMEVGQVSEQIKITAGAPLLQT